MYFSVVVLVIVNGQPTTDDDIDKQEISELLSVVAELREELAKVKGELASVKAEHAEVVARIGTLEGKLAAAVANIDTQQVCKSLIIEHFVVNQSINQSI